VQQGDARAEGKSYAQIYTDLVKRCGRFSIRIRGCRAGRLWWTPRCAVREAADKAVDEFDKGAPLQREAVERVRTCASVAPINSRTSAAPASALNDFVANSPRCESSAATHHLKEVRYVTSRSKEAEKQVASQPTNFQLLQSFCSSPSLLNRIAGRLPIISRRWIAWRKSRKERKSKAVTAGGELERSSRSSIALRSRTPPDDAHY
jgi:hypothetical protein